MESPAPAILRQRRDQPQAEKLQWPLMKISRYKGPLTNKEFIVLLVVLVDKEILNVDHKGFSATAPRIEFIFLVKMTRRKSWGV